MTNLEILKNSMSAEYCGKTRFDFLDEEEIGQILMAMNKSNQELTDALISIREYWNEDNNEKAMKDALEFIINKCDEVL